MSMLDNFLNELPKMVEPQLPKGKYTVWVDGTEVAVNVTEEVAEAVKESWIERGYPNVDVQRGRL